ncbi:MAG TPA: phosphatase PAP2 family protein [Gemmatimonadales bacterium]|nr:phosphatase PAP2 family protein [Gemmatimonadales bacterium]
MALTIAAPRWRLVDAMLAGYGVIVAALAATRLGQPGMVAVLGAHLALPVLAWLVVHAPPTATSRTLRALYPIILLTALYSAIDILNGFGAVTTIDHQLQSVEWRIFGEQPSRDWWRAHPSAFWSIVFHSAYLSYYLVITVPILYFLARRRTAAIERFLDGLLATYVICYLFYIFLPAAGPYYEFPRPSGAFIANLPARMVYAALSGGSAYGAAFPSSHVAATVACAIGGWRGSRRLGMILCVPAVLMTVGVVYCQMHYVVDSAAGLITGAVVAGYAGRRATTA